MKELLEKLSEKMPAGWTLWCADGKWRLYDPVDEATHCRLLIDLHLDLGDIGLAPLTALLKQSLGCYYMIEYMDRGNWSVRFSPHHFKAKSEFEAVATAYLALKENS